MVQRDTAGNVLPEMPDGWMFVHLAFDNMNEGTHLAWRFCMRMESFAPGDYVAGEGATPRAAMQDAFSKIPQRGKV